MKRYALLHILSLCAVLILTASRYGSHTPVALTHATDCTTRTDLVRHQECTDLDNGQKWLCADPALEGDATYCDDPSEYLATGGGSAATPTLPEVIAASGSTINVNLNGKSLRFLGLANKASAVRFCESTTDCDDGDNLLAVYVDPSTGTKLDSDPSGHIIHDADDGFDTIFRHNGTTYLTIDNSGAIQYANAARPVIPLSMRAGSFTATANCSQQTEAAIRGFAVLCSSTSGNFTLVFESDGAWDPSVDLTMKFTLETVGTDSHTFSADITSYCAGDGDARPTSTEFDGVTSDQLTIATGTTAGVLKKTTVTGITPGGSCAAGDDIYVRVAVDASHTAVDDFLTGVQVGMTYAQLGQ